MSGREPREREEKGSAALRGRWWVRPAKVVLTVGVTWLILRGAGIRLAELGTVDWALVRLDAPYLILSVTLLFAAFGIAAALWSRNLAELGERRVGVVEGAAILLIANLGRYVPGKILALAGVAMLGRRRGLSGAKATVAAVTAHMMHLLAAAAVGGWAVLWTADLPERWIVAAGLGIVAALAAALYGDWIGTLSRRILRRAGRTRDMPRPARRNLLLQFPGYVGHWVVLGGAFVCLGRSLGLEIGFAFGTATFAAAYFAGYVFVLAPAGIGIRESALVALLNPAVGLEASLVLAAMQRVWITAGEMLGAAGGALVLRRPAGPAAGGAA